MKSKRLLLLSVSMCCMLVAAGFALFPVCGTSGTIRSIYGNVANCTRFFSGKYRPNAEKSAPIGGKIRVEILDSKNICVIGSYADFLRSRFEIECDSFLESPDNVKIAGKEWVRNISYNTLGADIVLKYRPTIASAYQEPNRFRISDGVRIARSGYWIVPMGQLSFTDKKTGEEMRTKNAEILHCAFLELETPLKKNAGYTLTAPFGEVADFKFDAAFTNSAIKVNQVGYAPNAGRKYAYVGAWRGSLGALKFDLTGKSFAIIKMSDGKTVYRGTLKRRIHDVFYKSGASFVGEEVWEADFSEFRELGEYVLSIDGLGRSLPFAVSNDAIGESFYTHAKGLYHKRCGIGKSRPFTAWVLGKCHTTVYRSNFPPNNRHYKISQAKGDCGFFDSDGKRVDVDHFKLIALNASTNAPVNVAGGWHDAADYDRRPYHFDVVCDLLAAYLYRPQNFSDGQLNIPESGNGRADILDEAVWGMDIWRSLQNSDGSVGTWIEADSHPKEYNPAKDRQPYYLSAATMESSMQYSAHASMLALALKNAGDASANAWLDSARKAFEWADSPENRFTAEFFYPSNPRNSKSAMRKIAYRELPEVPAEYAFKAAFNLYLLTGEKNFSEKCKMLSDKMPKKFAETAWRINPFFFCEFIKYGRGMPEFSRLFAELKKHSMANAEKRLEWLNHAYPYRIAWYPPEHPYVSHMSWGNFHPFRNAKYFVNAYEITREEKYRDAAHLCNDFHNGANPFGQTMTSGLGKSYPVKFLDLPSYSDGISEYVLGITPYRNTFGINRDCAKLAFGLVYEPRWDRNFNPPPKMLLPESIVGEYAGSDSYVKRLAAAWPIFRRFANVEAYSVAASEYTVSETISPAVAVSGWLLEENWTPSESLKTREPVCDIYKLRGYWSLP